MNADQFGGIIRAFTPPLVAALSHWGIGTDASNTAIVTAVTAGVVAAWSAWTNRPGTVIPPAK